MRTKIYAVASGVYDIRIIGVFSAKPSADALADRHNRADGSEDTWVEIWELDTIEADLDGDIAFNVFYAPDSCSGNLWFVSGDPDIKELPFPDIKSFEGNKQFHTSRNWCISVWAHDKSDALKKGSAKILPVLTAAGIEVHRPDLTDESEAADE